MASFASSSTKCGARKHAWTNFVFCISFCKRFFLFSFSLILITRSPKIQTQTHFMFDPHISSSETEIPQKIGPGVLACATRGGGKSEAGHCFCQTPVQVEVETRSCLYFSPVTIITIITMTTITITLTKLQSKSKD